MRSFAVVCNINMAEYDVRELTEQDFLQETEAFVQPKPPARFKNFTDQDLNGIELLKDEKATTKQTTWGVKLLRGESATEVKLLFTNKRLRCFDLSDLFCYDFIPNLFL